MFWYLLYKIKNYFNINKWKQISAFTFNLRSDIIMAPLRQREKRDTTNYNTRRKKDFV